MMDHGPRNDFYMQQGHHAHDGWWAGPLHLLFLILFVALLVAGAVWLARRLSPGVAQAAAPAVAPAGAAALGGASDPAVATLRMRYARGEVSRDDFLHALADLTGAEAPTGTWPGGEAGEQAGL